MESGEGERSEWSLGERRGVSGVWGERSKWSLGKGVSGVWGRGEE